jgi:hypothetical protein
MILNSKVEFQNEVYDSNYHKINPNPILELTSQISPNSKVSRNSSEFLIKFYP